MKWNLFTQKKLLYLITFFSIVITALLGLTILNKDTVSNKALYTQRVQEQVQKHLQNIYADSDKITQIFAAKSNPTFSELNIDSKYPYFIYVNELLAFWSDYRSVPAHEQLLGIYNHKVIATKSGKYLVYKNSFLLGTDEVEVFFLLPILKRHQIDNAYVQSGFNTQVLPDADVTISNFSQKEEENVYAANDDFLFALDFGQQFKLENNIVNSLFIILGVLSITLLTLIVFLEVRRFIEAQKVELGLCLLAVYLLSIRALMLFFDIPYSIFSYKLFSPKYYASSIISPSLGDLLLNLSAVAIMVSFIFVYYKKSALYKKLKKCSINVKGLAAVITVTISYFILFVAFIVLRTIYFNSQWTLDITSSISFSSFKIISLLIFILVTGIYFILSHVVIRVFQALIAKRKPQGLIYFLIGTLLYVAISFFLNIEYLVVVLLHGLYFAIVYSMGLIRYLERTKYHTYIYLFLCAMVCAAIGTYSLQDYNKKELLINKNKFASQLLADNDVLGEYLLNEVSQHIKDDEFIKKRLLNVLSSKDIIEQKIKRGYLPSYFDMYDVQIIIFNAHGQIYTEIGEEIDYFNLKRIFNKPKYYTDYKNIFLLNDLEKNIFKQYLCFIEMQEAGMEIGYIVIDLKLKRSMTEKVYPELLVDKKYELPFQTRSYSYAIYADNELRYSFGNFNYEKYFKSDLLDYKEIYDGGLEIKGEHHLAVKGKDGKVVIISSPVYSLKNIFTNFSFLFLILIVFVFLLITLYSLYYKFSNINLNFATKIQIYLNLAFFLPLISVSIIITSAISRGYKEELNNSFTKRSENVGKYMVDALEKYKKNIISREELGFELAQISKYTETDINIFDRYGRLMSTSQPLIYEKELLSTYINPEALTAILEENEKTVLLQESVGKLNYNSVYIGLFSNESDRLMGILSIPFFESKYELDRQIIDVLSTIMNIFTTIFILFLVLSYFASQLLIEPLRMITQKIKKTTLDRNEPLEWQARDEIGLLVEEYNNMLLKLEASREALSRSEKESAWREMAQQVAHEIKNPLTPMKLTLQHLQRTIINGDSPSIQNHTMKAVNTLLVQVDNLNDIATSFSAFAKMPVPRNEIFEIVSLVRQTVNLYISDTSANVELEIDENWELYVSGDAQLMSRIITNLILNAIQSVPQNRLAQVIVKLDTNISKSSVIVEVTDNGAGIPDDIRDKIFMPNFSTKYAGSGIGLAMAKRGIEHAGGTIWYQTEEEFGTTFYIELPLIEKKKRF